jgi:hypothetical protein
MFRKSTLAGLTALGLLAAALGPVQAQIVVQPVVPHRPYRVEFRQLNWSAAIFTNTVEAQSFAQRKANRGYEVVEKLLPGQVQVTYRMPTWHSYAVVNHGSEAHSLARSLQAKGMEARVIH